MSEEKKQTKNPAKKIPVWLPLVLLAAAALVLYILFWRPAGQGNQTQTESGAAFSSNEKNGGSNTPETEPEMPNNELTTPVGTLYFPEDMIRQVEMFERTEDGLYSAAVDGFVGETRIRLFELQIGKEENGYLLGTAPDKAGESENICLLIQEIAVDPAWTEEQKREINILQSCVNDLIEQINQLPGFESPS